VGFLSQVLLFYTVRHGTAEYLLLLGAYGKGFGQTTEQGDDLDSVF